MKFLFTQLLLLLCWMSAAAQFTGYYIAQAKDTRNPEVRLVLEKDGAYHIFVNELYYHGKWTLIDKKIELILDNIDPVELYGTNGNKRAEQIMFTGFADRKAFFRLGSDNAFRPIFKELPKCSYENTQQIRVDRSKFNEVTVAINLPSDSLDTLITLYTYHIPEGYDEIYIDVNSNATRSGKKLVLELKGDQYVIENMQFEKQSADEAMVSQILSRENELLQNARIARFKKEHYLKTDSIERITPRISRNTIRIAADPIFVIDCPEVKDFPVVAPKQK